MIQLSDYDLLYYRKRPQDLDEQYIIQLIDEVVLARQGGNPLAQFPRPIGGRPNELS